MARGVGQQEDLLRDLLTSLLSGRGRRVPGGIGSVGRNLYQQAIGRPTPNMRQSFNRQLAQDRAAVTESFGSAGARYGTDLASALGRTSSDARLNFRNLLQERSGNALNQILNLGGTTSGFEFTRGENALERQLREFIAKLQMQANLAQILPQIIGGGGF